MKSILIHAIAACMGVSLSQAAENVALGSLDLSTMRQGYGRPQINKSITGKAIMLGGKIHESGVGSHSDSSFWLALDGGGERFQATVGVDDQANGPGSVVFRITGDDRELWQSGIMKPGDTPKTVDVDLKGVKIMCLEIADSGDGISFDHGNWAGARFVMTKGRPRPTFARGDEPVILTPVPGPQPRLNGPTRYGCRPGNPFVYRIPCQGKRPVRFSADGLPTSLTLDPQTGILTGTAPVAGEHRVTLHAKNDSGDSCRLFRIVSGETLALTPPMGWNHWYTHYDRITDKLMREAAEVMISSGMADVGYQYVNIDDCWMNAPSNKDPMRVGPLRDADGTIIPNKHFPDMKGLTDFIHSKGLKAGIYTSPGPLTCGGFAGAFRHEEQDAETFTEWGFDFLKHDWCSYGHIAKGGSPEDKKIPHWGEKAPDLQSYQYPYRLMGALLRKQPRDVVFNLCQYGMGDVWEWGADVGAQCWRTSGDLGFELNRITEVALKNSEHRAWSRPGSWNDPDYIQIGQIGNANRMGEPEPCGLTPNEQYTYMSLWSLMAAPLVFSGDMGKLDEFTLNVLCNAEVIEVNQDALGQGAAPVILTPNTYLMVKDLEDGGKAVGFFNRSEKPVEITAPWPVLGLQGPVRIRDLWRQKDLGIANGKYTARVPRHGVVIIRMSETR
jgi:alpha-galactosidase